MNNPTADAQQAIGNQSYAGFWRRLTAFLLDGLIIGIPCAILSSLLLPKLMQQGAPTLFYLTQGGGYLIAIAYNVYCLSSPWQATPGKRIMKVYVVRAEDGGRISPGRALARYAVLNASTLLLIAVTFTHMPPLPNLSIEERQQLVKMQEKMRNHEPLTAEEQQALTRITQPMQEQMDAQMGITPEEHARFVEIKEKKKAQQPVTVEEQQFFKTVEDKISAGASKNAAVSMISGIYMLAIALMIGLTRQKTGLHDIICKTRARRGTPQAPLVTYMTEA